MTYQLPGNNNDVEARWWNNNCNVKACVVVEPRGVVVDHGIATKEDCDLCSVGRRPRVEKMNTTRIFSST